LIVVDAAAVVDLLIDEGASGAWARSRIAADPSVHAPHLVDLEVAAAVRNRVLRGALTADRGQVALLDLADLPLTRYPATRLLGRIWQLRDAVTAYEAAYVALAEALGAPLLTTDRRLAGSTGHTAVIETPAV
jgi:predicted nucleic acid-binding protein